MELKTAIFKHLENLEIVEGSHKNAVRKMFEEIIGRYEKIGGNSLYKG
tara:strand:+ start:1363 stop:1506 length:144 start_codon:yes stop_codon:yes gene_type:complete